MAWKAGRLKGSSRGAFFKLDHYRTVARRDIGAYQAVK
jgi:hypothetical protein